MSAFELGNQKEKEGILGINSMGGLDSRRLREECIIALKVYDSCRNQDCLTQDETGPARAAECYCIGDRRYNEGDIIDPPKTVFSIPQRRLNPLSRAGR